MHAFFIFHVHMYVHADNDAFQLSECFRSSLWRLLAWQGGMLAHDLPQKCRQISSQSRHRDRHSVLCSSWASWIFFSSSGCCSSRELMTIQDFKQKLCCAHNFHSRLAHAFLDLPHWTLTISNMNDQPKSSPSGQYTSSSAPEIMILGCADHADNLPVNRIENNTCWCCI